MKFPPSIAQSIKAGGGVPRLVAVAFLYRDELITWHPDGLVVAKRLDVFELAEAREAMAMIEERERSMS